MTTRREWARAENVYDQLLPYMIQHSKAGALEVLTTALDAREREVWEQAAKVAENMFPFAATDGERLALHQCLRIAEECRRQGASLGEQPLKPGDNAKDKWTPDADE